MIYSMTAFARVQTQENGGSFVCEMRSINHRFLEASTHLPEALRFLEMPIRETIREFLKRGKIECSVRYQATEGSTISINTSLAKEFCHTSEVIAGFLKHPANVNPTDILRLPGVLQSSETQTETLQKTVLNLVTNTIKELIAARAREGEELKQLFLQRMDLMQVELAKVRERLPFVLVEQRERLLKRFADAKIELDSNRLEQEMVIFAQRMDVSEEIERTNTHITEIRRILKEGGLVGRRLDFLLQELNREANTLGSKSTDSVLTHAAVEMKVLIEQVREQVQNVE